MTVTTHHVKLYLKVGPCNGSRARPHNPLTHGRLRTCQGNKGLIQAKPHGQVPKALKQHYKAHLLV